MSEADFDICIIGGGINGAGIARDAAGRGLRVLLVEARDLGAATSSASTKLIHGGLRYLEHYDFKLVRESLKEQQTLLRQAPHIIRPMDFLLPHDGSRPAWMIRAGLFLYDRLGGRRSLRKSGGVDLKTIDGGPAFKDAIGKGFIYADCWVEDSRLVILNAVAAREKGARIMTQTLCTGIRADKDGWQIHVKDHAGRKRRVRASIVVNATGPWVRRFLDTHKLSTPKTPKVRLVKGSHIIVNRLYPGSRACLLPQPDGRVVFAIPFEKDYTMIGTTEKDATSFKPVIDADEIEYLCTAANRYFKPQITPEDALWAFSGIRPLFDDGRKNASAVTRDYRLIADKSHGPLLVSVFGGKLTTYRKLAADTMALINKQTGRKSKPWTDQAALPGGDIQTDDFDAFQAQQATRYPWLPQAVLERYARTYGRRMNRLIGKAAGVSQLGTYYGDHVYEAELRYLIQEEFARTVEDILWRRTRLGLHVAPQTVQNIEAALPGLLKETDGQ